MRPTQERRSSGWNSNSLSSTAFAETNNNRPSVIDPSYAGRSIVSLPTFLGAQFGTQTTLSDGVKLSAWARAAAATREPAASP